MGTEVGNYDGEVRGYLAGVLHVGKTKTKGKRNIIYLERKYHTSPDDIYD